MANYKSSSHRRGWAAAPAVGGKTARGADERAARPYPASEGAAALPLRAEVAKKPLKVEGNAELWVTLQKVTDATSGWVKTTRATAAGGGVILNTCSRKIGSAVVAEALVFVPGVRLIKTAEGVVLA